MHIEWCKDEAKGKKKAGYPQLQKPDFFKRAGESVRKTGAQ